MTDETPKSPAAWGESKPTEETKKQPAKPDAKADAWMTSAEPEKAATASAWGDPAPETTKANATADVWMSSETVKPV